MNHSYSGRRLGGIGYRLDIDVDGGSRYVSYTTNPDGSGLFFHNNRGDRKQVRGNGQFYALSLADFRRKTRDILKTWEATS